MKKEFVTRELKQSEIPKLKDFAPSDWQFKFDEFLYLHYGKNYFKAIVIVNGGKIVATANALMFGSVGWAANIIVSPSYRGQGLGYKITHHLIEIMLKSVDSILLIATKMGEELYKKLGFKIVESYSISEYKKIEIKTSDNIIPFENKYFDSILSLDFEATGENRLDLLNPFMQNTWIYISDSGNPEGFYIENYGDGTIIATNETAGKLLLEFKHSRAALRTVIPSSNKAAINHLNKLGIEINSDINRMLLGEDVHWKPDNIYSRIAGFCG